MTREVDQDELIDAWTIVGDEPSLIGGKRGATRLGFAILLRFYIERGRFPRGRAEIPDEAVAYVARQVGVERTEIAFYDWSGRTIEYHRAQIRQALGFRECSVADADALTWWLVDEVTQVERGGERVREHLLAELRRRKLEPPTAGRIDRIVAAGLSRGEDVLFDRVLSRLSTEVVAKLVALVAPVGDEGGELEGGSAVLASIRSDPGNVSLNTMLTEIAKLEAVRDIGVPDEVFAEIGPKIVKSWRARAAVESPSHLREHPLRVKLTLLAALLHCRRREITDTLVELLCSTVHRINARAEVRVTNELIKEFKRVTGKENLLFKVAEATAGGLRSGWASLLCLGCCLAPILIAAGILGGGTLLVSLSWLESVGFALFAVGVVGLVWSRTRARRSGCAGGTGDGETADCASSGCGCTTVTTP